MKLAGERSCQGSARAFLGNSPSVSDASREIKRLFTLRVTAPTIDLSGIPSGHYAAPDSQGIMRFLKVDKVDRGRWAGWIFVKAQTSDDYRKLGAQTPKRFYAGAYCDVLKSVLADPKVAAARYGHELGVCGICGRTLTDPVSIEAGIGPVCAKRF